MKKGKALGIFTYKLGRAICLILKNKAVIVIMMRRINFSPAFLLSLSHASPGFVFLFLFGRLYGHWPTAADFRLSLPSKSAFAIVSSIFRADSSSIFRTSEKRIDLRWGDLFFPRPL